jgi:hypothetical protein
MKNKIRSIVCLGAVCAITTLTLATGCSSTNKQQIANATSGTGVKIKAAVPVTSSMSIGLEIFTGKFNNTTVVQPTVTTNGVVVAPALAVVVFDQSKQNVTGSTSTSTNASATIANGGFGASVFVTGDATVLARAGTNTWMTVNATNTPAN